MKILFLTYCRAVLGANLSLLNLMLDLRERYNVALLVLIPSINDGDFHMELEKAKIPYFFHDMKAWVVSEDTKWKYVRGLKTFLHNKKEIKKWVKLLKRENIDLIYSNNSTIQYGNDLAMELNLPHIWHVREFLKEDYKITYNYPRFIVKNKFERSKKIITVSEALKSYFENNTYRGDNIVAINNGIKNDKKLKTEWNYNKKLKICNVGALQEGKNQLELLQAANRLIGRGITEFHITLVGSGEEYEKKLKKYCSDNNLEKFVTFAGYCSNVSEILDEMDVGVICSKNEAFGRVTVEYMLSSLAVIGAAGAGTSEIIEHEHTGCLYDSGDIEELANCINKFISNRDLLVEIGSKAFKIANEKFTLEKNTDSIYKILEEITMNN